MIPFSTYLRIEAKAGGVSASHRDLIRATRTFLKPNASREGRHQCYRAILNCNARVRGFRETRGV